MKCRGLIGSVNDAMTGAYVQAINVELQKQFGAGYSAEHRVSCVDTAASDALLSTSDWRDVTNRMIDAIRRFIRRHIKRLVICDRRPSP